MVRSMRFDDGIAYEDFLRPDGSRLGRVATLVTQDQGFGVWAGAWVCEPMHWRSPFDASEIFYVIAGRATVEINGESFTLEPGTAFCFDKGDDAAWSIEEELRAWVVVL